MYGNASRSTTGPNRSTAKNNRTGSRTNRLEDEDEEAISESARIVQSVTLSTSYFYGAMALGTILLVFTVMVAVIAALAYTNSTSPNLVTRFSEPTLIPKIYRPLPPNRYEDLPGSWLSFGRSYTGERSVNSSATSIDSKTVNTLEPHWAYVTGSGSSGYPGVGNTEEIVPAFNTKRGSSEKHQKGLKKVPPPRPSDVNKGRIRTRYSPLRMQPSIESSKAWMKKGGVLHGTNPFELMGMSDRKRRGDEPCINCIAPAVLSQPAAYNGQLFFCDGAGMLTSLSVNQQTGYTVAWSVPMGELTGMGPSDYCISTPAVDPYSGLVIVGSNTAAFIVAVSIQDGSLAWTTRVSNHPEAIITQSVSVADGVAIVGVSSIEETTYSNLSSSCCSFRGLVVALSIAQNGAIVWKTPMVPEGYVGAAVSVAAPTIDIVLKQVYVVTGALYVDPVGIYACSEEVKSLGLQLGGDPCLPQGVNTQAILALDYYTGWPNWVKRIPPVDVWNLACNPVLDPGVTTNPNGYMNSSLYMNNCPVCHGNDTGFAQAPMIVSPGDDGYSYQLIVGQKTGIQWALDPRNGNIMYQNAIAPGGVRGGIDRSGAALNQFVCMPVSNSRSIPFAIVGSASSSQTTTNGSAITCIDTQTSTIMWEFPQEPWIFDNLPLTIAGDVLFVPSSVRLNDLGEIISTQGALKAFSLMTGELLWTGPLSLIPTTGVTVIQDSIFFGAYQLSTRLQDDSYILAAFKLS